MDETRFEGVLDDGTRILLRPIRADDKERIVRGLASLSPESRYLRFFRNVDRFSADQLRYLTEVDGVDHCAWMAVLPDVPGEPGAGVARWIRLRDAPDQAEAAVTVVDEMQGRGIGSALLWVLGRSALDRGVKAFRVAVLGDNHPMLHLLTQAGAQRGPWQSGVVEFTVPLTGELLGEPPARLVLEAVAAGLGEEDPP
ncbi:MAG: GNAT family N-acetyltransferase [Actinomycetota bacterium]|nr:GNAT family N-acetyltransferase [Actinomycetota bacterium]